MRRPGVGQHVINTLTRARLCAFVRVVFERVVQLVCRWCIDVGLVAIPVLNLYRHSKTAQQRTIIHTVIGTLAVDG